MNSVATYRIEDRLAGQPREIWGRGTVSREQAIELFDVLVADDAVSDAPVFGPHTGHRLVVLANPPTSAPVSSENAQDLPAQAWLMLYQEHRRGRIRLGSPTTPERARATAQRVRSNRPAGSSDWIEVHPVVTR